MTFFSYIILNFNDYDDKSWGNYLDSNLEDYQFNFYYNISASYVFCLLNKY